jgi:hypothetical protein
MEHDRLNLTGNAGQYVQKTPVILSSRQRIVDELSQAWIRDRLGVKTLTGESGIGKSFLWRSASDLVKSQCDNIRWITLSILPRNTSLGLLHAILIALDDTRIPTQMTAEQMLAHVEYRFVELFSDGFRPEIVVEEAHHLSREGFETLRILKDRLAHHGFKTGMLLVGQTALKQKSGRLSRLWRPYGWHIQHIGAAETFTLLNYLRGEFPWTRAEADWIHREALGNPGRIIRWTETLEPTELPPPSEKDMPMLKPGHGRVEETSESNWSGSRVFSESLLPVKPPLEESDGLIEVGYDDSETDSPEPDDSSTDQSESREIFYEREEEGTKARYWIDSGAESKPYRPNSAKSDHTHEFDQNR